MARHRDDVAQIRLPRGAEFRTVAGADEPRSPIYACCRSKKSRSDQCRPSNVTPSGPGLLVILYASNLKKKKCAAQQSVPVFYRRSSLYTRLYTYITHHDLYVRSSMNCRSDDGLQSVLEHASLRVDKEKSKLQRANTLLYLGPRNILHHLCRSRPTAAAIIR